MATRPLILWRFTYASSSDPGADSETPSVAPPTPEGCHINRQLGDVLMVADLVRPTLHNFIEGTAPSGRSSYSVPAAPQVNETGLRYKHARISPSGTLT